VRRKPQWQDGTKVIVWPEELAAVELTGATDWTGPTVISSGRETADG
jgi:hypothetical protein